eukprot:10210549-Lingulodinium_polyedra.AAC.1
MQKWEEHLRSKGFRSVVVTDRRVPTPSGVGGQTKVEEVRLVPTGIGGVPGVMEVIVVAEDTLPPLIPIGMLDMLEATMDMKMDVLTCRRIGRTTPMTRLPSGHRTIQLDEVTPE